MTGWMIIGISFSYLLLLFGIAHWAEKHKKRYLNFFHSPYIYALSLAVYCSAWTFYGSIGRVDTDGLDFLTTYLGPVIAAPLFGIVLKKMIRISKTQGISTVADFISARYGKSSFLGVLVSVISLLGVIPYISLQIKAIASSLSIVLSDYALIGSTAYIPLYITIFLAVFVLIYGNRHIDSTRQHIGMVTAVAFESIVKLMAFLTAGIFICYGLFNGLDDIFSRGIDLPVYPQLTALSKDNSYINWFSMTVLAFFAVLLLPRQFQLGVVENIHEKQVDKAMWIFPIYLLIINFFVLPIALAGFLYFDGQSYDADYTLLLLPLKASQPWIVILVYLGGFSAATGMIIVETTALAVMLSNNILMPLVVAIKPLKRFVLKNAQDRLRSIRKFSIVLILILAYGYYRSIAHSFKLSELGHISFVAIIQFAPSLLIGMFWKDATKIGAKVGLIVGFLVWFYTLIVPSLVEINRLPQQIVEEGIFGLSFLKPASLFGLTTLDTIPHAVFWSMTLNLLSFIAVSVYTKKDALETIQAELFVEVFKYYPTFVRGTESKGADDPLMIDKGAETEALYSERGPLSTLLETFFGKAETVKLFKEFQQQHSDNLAPLGNRSFYYFVEQRLSGIIGSASAKVMMASLGSDHHIDLQEVVEMVRESQQLISLNKELTETTAQLKRATEALAAANQQLQEADERKNEFLYTITHELRTPLTSIRAFAEILYDHPDLDDEQRREFLQAMTSEIERLSRLITEVLDLERLDIIKEGLNLQPLRVDAFISESVRAVSQLKADRNIKFDVTVDPAIVEETMADIDLLKQVMINLLSNAVKFCDQQSGHIGVNVWQESAKIVFEVTDNGAGIEEELYDKVFEKFFQATQANQGNAHVGSGLGLAISKKIVERHGGRIWVAASGKAATSFRFYIPLSN